MKKRVPYILLADDDPDDQELLIPALLKELPSIGVEYVNNGDRVITWLEACTPADLPALILLDYKMPMFTAPEVLEHLAANRRYASMPKFVWSTSARTDYIEQCKRFGAAAYFTKPNTDLELSDIVLSLTQAFHSHFSHPVP